MSIVGALILIVVLAVTGALVALWNRRYPRVPWRIAALFWLIVCGYQADTLFTRRVDLPGGLAFVADPWKALHRPVAHANTGIVFTQLAPWTLAARRSLAAGEWPSWNRDSACGAPLAANQQTALAHPFTLLGLPFRIGHAFTLSACLRLFTLLFFTFAFLQSWELRLWPSVFGAISYTFCTFHIVWLLFPLGLTTMMLPVALTGIQLRSRCLLTAGLALALLGGHPESALFTGLTAGAYAIYVSRNIRFLAWAASCAAVAMLLTAFWWMPAWSLLRDTSRHALMQHAQEHHFSAQWFLPLVAPNILGTPQRGTYKPPQPANPGVLDDYGEVASGYTGILALLLAPFAFPRKRPTLFFAGAIVFALLTIAEVPGWTAMLRHVPLLGIALWQRWRFLIPLGLSVMAAIALDRLQWPDRVTIACCALAFIELTLTTRRYNPPAAPRDVYPATGAIAFLQRDRTPHRFVAAGWSFLADTASAYGLEDVKTTDPMASPHYLRMVNGYLAARDYDQIVNDFSQPYVDFLNIKYVYAPPGAHVSEPRFRRVYSGADGDVYENTAALPRYFIPRNVIVAGGFDMKVALAKQIRNFAETAVAGNGTPLTNGRGGSVTVTRYGPSSTTLAIVLCVSRERPSHGSGRAARPLLPSKGMACGGRAAAHLEVNEAARPPGQRTAARRLLARVGPLLTKLLSLTVTRLAEHLRVAARGQLKHFLLEVAEFTKICERENSEGHEDKKEVPSRISLNLPL
jgi:hypothetical protein